MSLENALELCRTKRPGVEPIPAFLDQLSRYEIKCREDGLIPSCTDDSTGKKNRSETDKSSANQDSTRKRKDSKYSGTIGPSLPPSSKRRVIGPGLPEENSDINAIKSDKDLEELCETGRTTIDLKTSLPTKRQASIGPSLPPGFMRRK